MDRTMTAYQIPTFPPENEAKINLEAKDQLEEVKQRHEYWETESENIQLLPNAHVLMNEIKRLHQRCSQLENGQYNMLLLMRDRLVAYHRWVNSIKKEDRDYMEKRLHQLFGWNMELIDESTQLLGELARWEPVFQGSRDLIALQIHLGRMERKTEKNKQAWIEARRKALKTYPDD